MLLIRPGLSSDLKNISKNCTKSTVSLCEIPSQSTPEAAVQRGPSAITAVTDSKPNGFSSAVNVNERSDSPILAGIDKELAKYAKLKDLEKAYKPPSVAAASPPKDKLKKHVLVTNDLTSATAMLRHPDGASNPDLNATKSPMGNLGTGVTTVGVTPGLVTNSIFVCFLF